MSDVLYEDEMDGIDDNSDNLCLRITTGTVTEPISLSAELLFSETSASASGKLQTYHAPYLHCNTKFILKQFCCNAYIGDMLHTCMYYCIARNISGV